MAVNSDLAAPPASVAHGVRPVRRRFDWTVLIWVACAAILAFLVINPVARLVISAFVGVAPEHKLRLVVPADSGGGFGIKQNILRLLALSGCEVRVVPATTTAAATTPSTARSACSISTRSTARGSRRCARS